MRLLRLVPDNTRIDFVGKRFVAFGFTLALFLVTIASLTTQGLNLGIDFRGGILIEAQAPDTVDTPALRHQLDSLGLGEVELQQIGGPRDVLIRIQQQEGGEATNRAAIEKIRSTLGPQYDYRRVELVGPKVGGELLHDGVLATALAVVAIALYVGVRFEWQFGVAALIATFHDVCVTAGLFSVLGLEFNLTAIAALLTLAGYSINDTVVVFDRIRENMRRQKGGDLKQVVNDSVNQTLSRTIVTSGVTLLAILPLLIYGGPTLFNFTVALTWGILIGTYSSIYVAASLLLYMKPIRRAQPTMRDAAASAIASEGR